MSSTRHRVAVLGGGLVGGTIARRLSRYDDIEVTLADRDATALARAASGARLTTHQADLGDPAGIAAAASGADAVALAVPGSIGLAALRTLVDLGKPVVDISFTPEDPRLLDARARERGVAVVVDCGVMPGFGGMLALHLAGRLAPALSARIMVGGLPRVRLWPYEYKAPFSPSDVIEEYVRPARLRRAGALVTVPALSEVEAVDVPGVGTLEAFLTDGLRTLLDTLDVPDLCEKTLRWPGHAERMRMLRDTGFFSPEPIDAGGVRVAPLAVTERLLRAAWRLEPDEDELTIMVVEVDGRREGAPARARATVFDRREQATGDSSMARTTGLPAVLTLRALLDGRLSLGAGVVPAEILARDEPFFAWLCESLRATGIAISIDEGPD